MKWTPIATAGAFFVASACGAPDPGSDKGVASASTPSPASILAAAKRLDLFNRALGALTRPAHFRLDNQPIFPDSALAVVRTGGGVKIIVFTGSPPAGGGGCPRGRE